MTDHGPTSPIERALNAYARAFQRWLPSPFAIAVVLTFMAAGLALSSATPSAVVGAWTTGLWNPGLLRFGFQAMFMLVLGHVLALAPPVLWGLNRAVCWVTLTPRFAPAKVALLSMVLGWLNWGLGLVAGAILVRGVLDEMQKPQASAGLRSLSQGMLGAAGYTGLLVWHGGLSGSAPLKVAEAGHLASLVPQAAWAPLLPETISLTETVFAPWSLMVTGVVVAAVVALFAWLGGRVKGGLLEVEVTGSTQEGHQEEATVQPAETLGGVAEAMDTTPWIALGLGAVTLGGACWWALQSPGGMALSFVTPDWINMLLLALALFAHGQVRGFLAALDKAIGGASGILVQFPLYFGIMGIVTGTGLGPTLAGALVDATSAAWLPETLFVSAGVLNVFVPSGGGQWAVQGPLVLEACHALGVSWERGIMAMAFGDELTNMLQPFWALPLLGITGLSARDILPYTLLVMVTAGTVMLLGMSFW
ncbi:MAG: TIGR00366 family protein [Flavobacteriales bacterium]